MSILPKISGHTVASSMVRDLCRGSFEELTSRLDEAVAGLARPVGVDGALRVVATFPTEALIASDNGLIFRAKFEDKKGKLSITITERVEAPAVTSRNLDRLLKKQTLEAVDLLLRGDASLGGKLLTVRQLGESRTSLAEHPVVESVVSASVGDRPWRKLYSENRNEIRSSVDAALFEKKRIDPKFAKLYDGTIPESRFGEFRSLVVESSGKISVRLKRLSKKIESVYGPFVTSIADVALTPEDDQIVARFKLFVEDLVKDIRETQVALAEAIDRSAPPGLGQVHDAIAGRLTDLEIASKFVEGMALSLTKKPE